MLARKDAVKVAQKLFDEHEGACSHIGLVAIRQLLDAIYDGPPQQKNERLWKDAPRLEPEMKITTRLPDVKIGCHCESCRSLWKQYEETKRTHNE